MDTAISIIAKAISPFFYPIMEDQRIPLPDSEAGFDAYFEAALAALSGPARDKLYRYLEAVAASEAEAAN